MIVLQAALLVATVFGAGALLVDARRHAATWIGRLALSALAGSFLLAPLLSSLAFVGTPRAAILAVGYALAAAGFVAAWRRRSPEPAADLRRELLALAPVGLLALTPAISAFTAPTLCHDAVAIWYPKTVEAAQGLVPDPESFSRQWPRHAHAEYPRGLAGLATVADPLGEADPRLVRIVSLMIVVFGAWALVGWFARRGDLVGGVLAACLVLAVPEMAKQCHVGMGDPPIGIAVLMLGLAFTDRRDGDPAATILVALAGAGAAATKQEGAVAWLLAVAFVALRALRGDARERRIVAVAAAILLTVVPWWLGRSKGDAEVLSTWSLIYSDPLFVATRIAMTMEKVALAAGSLAWVDPDVMKFEEPPVAVVWFLAATIPLVRFAARRPIVTFPAFLILGMELAVWLVTPHGLVWQIWTTIPRLPLHGLPLLIAASVACVRPKLSAA